MIVAALLAQAALGAALQVAAPPAPPPPPAPPAPPAAAFAPAPPPPPLPPLPPYALEGRHRDAQVMSFDEGGRHVTIIKRRAGEPGRPMRIEGDHDVLRYKDAEGRDVTVITDHPVTQAEAEKMERDLAARIPKITKDAMDQAKVARADAEVYRRDALRSAADARRDGDIARKEGEKARDYAQVIIKRMKDKDGNWKVGPGGLEGFSPGDFGPELDGPGGPHVFVRRFDRADGGDLRALRDEVHALRDEVRALKEQLRSGPIR